MEILNIKISRFPEIIKGVKLYENEKLLIILSNPVDYMLDGIFFINKKYIKNIEKTKDLLSLVIFKHKINVDSFIGYKSFDTIYDTIKYHYNQSKLVELTLESSSYSIIGNIQHINEKSFFLNMLSVKAEYLQEEKFEYDKIRIVTVNSDYLNSLEYYLSISNN
ncbi:hypothetical protein [Chryseobacterium viscerum]|uniref:Uncharacterized protein n=1 Tax=Chryseobacterium viscerum TaxID=1037377 RepID=A0A316WD65_9FLAO|nr:hypothetical protein [Chryseobacterium viscerum]PWN59237.1 hypothetical protein C1634_018120 [Chryseobacterium viscerum]